MLDRYDPMNLVQAFLFLCLLYTQVFASTVFVNFETAPVHPIALSPDRKWLAACNLPDGAVELFELQQEAVVHRISLKVGIDPVSARFRNADELWVVNAMSDSINIIDLRTFRVLRVISTQTRPADVVFAGQPTRAFVACSADNVVEVLDPDSGTSIRRISIPGERPRALAVSPDGTKVYAAIFESGNGTTIIAPRVTDLGHTPPAGPVDLPIGPYGGLNPPPNRGTNFYPAIDGALTGSNAPPRASLIVRRTAEGRWLDDNEGDWTEMISGTNAAFTGRIPGWDLTDHDVVSIDPNTFDMTFIDRLMNICMDLAVNPRTGVLAVVGTEAMNHVRYEPLLKSVFTRIQLALADMSTNSSIRLADLNPHLDYSQTNIPPAERQATIGDPRGVVWNDDGTRLYVSGMGSDNVVMLDASGQRLAVSSDLPEGPTGLVYDGSRRRLYLLSRFASKITILDADNLAIVGTAGFFDPTPDAIRKGRRHFYNTRKSSGLGQASCASCHVDGRFDRLAWDLGAPTGEMGPITTNSHNFVASSPSLDKPFHPMKGPMVTQTLQDIIGHEPFHWRGDRVGIEEFNPTFTELQGADKELTDAEMQDFEDFLATIRFPPNRLRTFENGLPTQMALTNHTSLGRGQRFRGDPLPNGNAASGMQFFSASGLACLQCHSMPTGNGPDRVFSRGRWVTIPLGPRGEHHLGLSVVPRSDEFPFKVAQLRSLPDKLGFNLQGTSRAGFGFLHDGRTDSLTRFLQDGFALADDKQTADLIAFLLAFSGSDLPANSNSTVAEIVPGTPGLDAPAAMGKQLLLTNDSTLLDRFIGRANSSTGRLDLVVTTTIENRNRGWFYLSATRQFKPDTREEPVLSRSELFAAVTNSPLLFTLVLKGAGERLSIDRDADGFLNYDEVLAGTDPADARSGGAIQIISAHLAQGGLICAWSSPLNRKYNVLGKDAITEPWHLISSGIATASVTTNTIPIGPNAQGYFRLEVLPE